MRCLSSLAPHRHWPVWVELTYPIRCHGTTAICAFETWGDVSNRREADIADRGRVRRSWAGSARTRVGSGRTGVRAEAAIPLRARNKLHPPRRKFGLRNRTAGRLGRNSTNTCFSVIRPISPPATERMLGGTAQPASTSRSPHFTLQSEAYQRCRSHWT
jgi:hypothetical protein